MIHCSCIRLNLFLIVLVASVAISCTPNRKPSPTISVSPTATRQPSPSPTFTPTATQPATLLQSAPTQTPTSTPSATATRALGSKSDSVPLPTNTPTPTTVKLICILNVDTLRLREGPGTDYKITQTLSATDTVSALKSAPDGEWLLVETRQKDIGWILASAVSCKNNLKILPVAQGVRPKASPTQTPSPSPTASPTVPLNSWRGEYYDNASLLGEPVFIREDPDINFNWILDSPAPGIPADNFSIRWTRLYDITDGGDYRFFADVDDGIRLYVDNILVIDAWHTFMPVPYVGDFADLAPGRHTVIVEYFESGGHAKIKMWVDKTRFIDDEWRGEYYNNPTLHGPPVLLRRDRDIDFNWGDNSPADELDNDGFSVRWRRTIFFNPGDYKFVAEVANKDQVKIFLDGWLLVNEYRKNSGTIEGRFDNVGAGYHDIDVEYIDDRDRAKIKFWWEKTD